MAYIAPIAPKNFYTGGLDGFKAALEAVNGVTAGKIVLLSGLPTDIEAAWAQCGLAADGNFTTGATMGTLVLGGAALATIGAVVAGDIEGGSTETGWKLVFDAIANVPITEVANATAIACALVVGRDTFAVGTNADVRYVIDMVDLPVNGTPGGVTVNAPTFDVEIGYGVNK